MTPLSPQPAAAAGGDAARGRPNQIPPAPTLTIDAGRTGQHHRPRRPACRSRCGPRSRPHRRRIDTIVCDIDEVVISSDPNLPTDIEHRHGLRKGCLLDTLLRWPTAQLASVGALTYPTWLRYACDTLPPQAVQEWLDNHGSLNHQVIELLAASKQAGVRLYFLANSTARLRDDLAHHTVSDLADQTFCSAEIGYAKPDPRAYQHVLDTVSLRAARTLYIDDIASWVATGRQLGMRGHVYTTAAQLHDELARAGVTP